MKNNSLMEQVKTHLETIKRVQGVENAVLTQRDGNPIQSVGVWLSPDEVFKVSAATSAIFNCGIELYPTNLKYILIEGKRAKILLAPLRNTDNKAIDRIVESQGLLEGDNEFYTAITAQPNINLGGIFLKTRQSLIEIKKALIMSGESFKPPLRNYSEEEVADLLDSFSVKQDLEHDCFIHNQSVSIDEETSQELDKALHELSKKVMDLNRAFVTIEGGFLAGQIQKHKTIPQYQLDAEASMSFSLFSTADQCAWLLKKMQVSSILIECTDKFQFINRLSEGVFSVQVSKGNQRLGLLRMILPKYIGRMASILAAAKTTEVTDKLDLKSLFGELMIQ